MAVIPWMVLIAMVMTVMVPIYLIAMVLIHSFILMNPVGSIQLFDDKEVVD